MKKFLLSALIFSSATMQADSGWETACKSGIAAPLILGLSSWVAGHNKFSFVRGASVGVLLVAVSGAYNVRNPSQGFAGACVAAPLVGHYAGDLIGRNIRYYRGCPYEDECEDYYPRHHRRHYRD